MDTPNNHKKYIVARIFIGLLLFSALCFLGYLGIMKILEKNVLAHMGTNDLQTVLTIHTDAEREGEFDAFMEKYPLLMSTFIESTGLSYDEIWSAIQMSHVKSIYVAQYVQGRYVAWTTAPGAEDREALSRVIQAAYSVEERDGIYFASLSGELALDDMLESKDNPSIASLAQEFPSMSHAMVSLHTYSDWDTAAYMTQALDALPVSSTSLLLHSITGLLQNTATHLLYQDGLFAIATDVGIEGNIGEDSFFKNTVNTSSLRYVPKDVTGFLLAHIESNLFDVVRSYLKNSVSEQSAIIFTNSIYTWLQDVFKTTSPSTFIEGIPSTDMLIVRYDDQAMSVLLDDIPQAKQGELFDQIYTAIRLTMATEEVPVTLPDNTKSTYLRLNNDLIQRETLSSSGATMQILKKEEDIIATSRTQNNSMLVTTATGSILTDMPEHTYWTDMLRSRFSTPMNAIVMLPISYSETIIENGEGPASPVVIGIKFLKESIHIEFLLQ